LRSILDYAIPRTTQQMTQTTIEIQQSVTRSLSFPAITEPKRAFSVFSRNRQDVIGDG
jgi:hypothetical protein